MARPKGLPKSGGRRLGTPNKATAPVRALAGQFTEEAVATLAEIMVNPDVPPAARVSAASALLDRGHGKPPQAITGAGGSPLIPERAADPDRIAQALLLMLSAPGSRPARALIEHRATDVTEDADAADQPDFAVRRRPPPPHLAIKPNIISVIKK